MADAQEQGGRLESLIDSLGHSQVSMAEAIGISQSYISQMVSGSRNISRRVLHAITNKFQNVNVRWLITGEGELRSSMKDLIRRLWEIAAENPKGFTVTIPDCEPVKSGFAIGHRDTQNCFGERGLKKVVEHSLETTKVVGGWKGYNERYYFDTVIITHDAEEAFDLKEAHQQLAIYHIDTGRIF